jgi:hypothetical protein
VRKAGREQPRPCGRVWVRAVWTEGGERQRAARVSDLRGGVGPRADVWACPKCSMGGLGEQGAGRLALLCVTGSAPPPPVVAVHPANPHPSIPTPPPSNQGAAAT